MPLPNLMRSQQRQRGAVLLLLIMALSVGAASLALKTLNAPKRQVEQERRTLVALAEAREALLGFASTHGRLPRPATSTTNGNESKDECKTEASCTGYLPWVTLGIHGYDGWGKLLHYSVTASLATYPVGPTDNVADKVIYGRDAQGNKLIVAGLAKCSLDTQCVPLVVFSSGRNNFGVTETGIAQPNLSTANVDEGYNDTAVNGFVTRPMTDDINAPGGDFDDMVSWIPIKTLFRRMYSAGVLR